MLLLVDVVRSENAVDVAVPLDDVHHLKVVIVIPEEDDISSECEAPDIGM